MAKRAINRHSYGRWPSVALIMKPATTSDGVWTVLHWDGTRWSWEEAQP